VRILNRLTLGAAIVALFLVTLTVLASVIVRYFSLGSFYGVDELSRFGSIWLVFLGVPAAMQYRQHIAFDTFLQALTPRRRLWADLVVQLLSGAFLTVFTWQGLLLAQQTHDVKSPGLELPMSLAYAAVPIGGGLMVLNLLVSIRELVRAIFRRSMSTDGAVVDD
jgi:TRAP-type C4-dicarboxylate transport system permease small subunit